MLRLGGRSGSEHLRGRATPWVRAHWHWSIPIVVIAGLLVPPLLSDRTFATDWGNHLWLVWVQGLSIKDLGGPSYFLQSSLGVFYPYFAFYGGSMYAALGLVSAASTPELAVGLGYAAALAACYLGWTWIARQVGIRGWQSQLPGCLAVTAPLAVTNLFGRGDIPEAVATSMLPLVAASALSIVREPRVRLRSTVAYVGSVVVLTGTHTLTLVWGTTFLMLCAALLAACYWTALVERGRRVLTLIGLGLLGVGINAWILMPLVLYHGRLAENEPDPIGLTAYTDPLRLISPLRDVGDPYSVVRADVNVQLPILALLWVVVCGAIYWRFFSARDKAVGLGLVGIFAPLMVLILSPQLIESLPEALRFIQFPYRLLTYVDLCVVALVTLVLAALQRAGAKADIPILLLVGSALFSFGISIDQNARVRSWLTGRGEALISSTQPPPSWYAPLQFADGSAPIVRPTLEPALKFPVAVGDDESDRASYPPGPGGTVATNIATGSYLVELSGARPVGRTEGGMMVVRLPASPGHPRPVVVRPAWGTAMTVGRWLSVISLLIAVLAAAAYSVLRRRRPDPSAGA
jgi:hypothetical protein